jgi:carboxypeptidase Taq
MSMDAHEAYVELIRRAKEQAVLGSCSSLMGWDEQTYMPRSGAAHRGGQMALLAGLHHERATDPRIGDLLAIVEGSDLVSEAGARSAVNVRELRRSYDRRVRLPRALVEDLARTTSLAQPEWVAARAASDFSRFRPWLEKIVQLKRQESACLSDRPERGAHAAPGKSGPSAEPNGGSPGSASIYDPLLDEYEPGASTAELANLFQALRRELVPLVATIAEASRRRSAAASSAHSQSGASGASVGQAILRRSYPRDRQKIFGEAVARAVGFDFQRGRLDVTAHPFCTGIGPGDCRITTRFDDHNFSDAFFGILHEVGHGLYEQGLDQDHYGTPMGEAVSLGIHESQSRLWENAVGRGRAFWTYWFPIARCIFPEALADVTLDAFHAAVNHVEPSLIRVQADEATYNLHIIVRFEIEQALLNGDLAVADLPAAWNQKYQETLGVTPKNDAEGCLQDIHWSAGLVGYFPTYTLGNLYAAQLFEQAQTDLGGMSLAFARGDFSGLLSWLRTKVHREGQRHRPAELIEHIVRNRPHHRALMDSLRRKYGELYDI